MPNEQIWPSFWVALWCVSLCWVSFMLNVANKLLIKTVIKVNVIILSVIYAECDKYALKSECHYGVCHYTECHLCWMRQISPSFWVSLWCVSLCWVSMLSVYAECGKYALPSECHYGVCHYAECHLCWVFLCWVALNLRHYGMCHYTECHLCLILQISSSLWQSLRWVSFLLSVVLMWLICPSF